MTLLATLATCNLDQWALDFVGNTERIKESIRIAKAKGAKYRLGPELEISGYGCEDHFLEQDTFRHCWDCLADIITEKDLTEDIICDIGMPVLHNGVPYNCRVWVLNGQILFIRPKFFMASDGLYREERWFCAWTHQGVVEDHILPERLRLLTGQTRVPFGDCCLATQDTLLASETCEELFTPDAPHIYLGLSGVEIFGNGSGSHHQLRKLDARVDLIRGATKKGGGIYLYANQQGCDGGRMYFDGTCMIFVNGQLLAQGSQFSLLDVEVVTATVNLDDVRSYRGAIASRNVQASKQKLVPRVNVDWCLSRRDPAFSPSTEIKLRLHSPYEEIALGPACWLWDYLRRSGMGGFFLPLSGGADSSSTAAIVGSMCKLVVRQIVERGNALVLQDVRKITRDDSYTPTDPRDLAGRIFFTCYMATKNSSQATRDRAKLIAEQVGATHLDANIDEIVGSFQATFTGLTQMEPKFKVFGGSNAENLALQNIQARSRMVFGYMLSQLLLWTRGKPGSLLVLGSANVDESLRGYLTKYDCSSADINPIGSISKADLRKFLDWAALKENLGYTALASIREAPPTAELEPITAEYTQTDEQDMGMTYDELSVFGKLRKEQRCGPVSMFQKLVYMWEDKLTAREIAEKVKRFFFYYCINRHKMTVLTPAYHAEAYSPEDNRYDLRQFLYNSKWDAQFSAIDELVEEIEENERRCSAGEGASSSYSSGKVVIEKEKGDKSS
ncbi:Glutamine-dependent NAD(+) synthetase [Balamuthia mandrillaris]